MTTLTLPTAGDIVAGIATYSTAMFTEFLPVIWIPLGLTLAAVGLLFLVRNGKGFAYKLLGGGKKKRSR